MKTIKVLIASVLTIPLFFGIGINTHAKQNEVPDKSFVVEIDVADLQDELNHIQYLMQKETNKEKLKELKDSEKQIIRELKKTDGVGDSGGISTFALNKSYWSWGEGDYGYNSNYSSNEPNNFTSISLRLDDVTWSGFDWSGSTTANWYGSSPFNVYSISNDLTMHVTGVAISGSLTGLAFSGSTSGSKTITNTNAYAWQAGHTFDAFSSGSTIKAVFTSSSSVKKYSNSSTMDTTSAQITIYDPSF